MALSGVEMSHGAPFLELLEPSQEISATARAATGTVATGAAEEASGAGRPVAMDGALLGVHRARGRFRAPAAAPHGHRPSRRRSLIRASRKLHIYVRGLCLCERFLRPAEQLGRYAMLARRCDGLAEEHRVGAAEPPWHRCT